MDAEVVILSHRLYLKNEICRSLSCLSYFMTWRAHLSFRDGIFGQNELRSPSALHWAVLPTREHKYIIDVGSFRVTFGSQPSVL